MGNDNRSSVTNFGKGWEVIFYCMGIFWFYVGMVNDGSNITAPAVAKKLGEQAGTVLNMNSIAGIVGVLLFIIIGQINRKIGARICSAICTIIAGISYIIIGNSSSLAMYTFAMICIVGSIMSAGYISGGTLVAQWFPKKKGVVMGYTTMGHNLASALYVPFIAFLVGKFGIEKGVVLPSVIAMILGILGFIFIRNTPQEKGLNPDNVSDEVYKNEYFTSEIDHDGGWTTMKLLKTKELWLAAITTGCFQICSVGVMSQLVVRNMSLGFTQVQAISIMTVVACIGVFGSFLIGVFDDKWGTKKTMIYFGLWYMLALIANVTETKLGIYLSIFMIGMAIGGSANFTTSLPASIFGRHGFDKVNSVIFPIQGLITALCFAVNGFVLNLTGNLRYAYMIFAGVALFVIILMFFVDEHRFNRDWHVTHKD
ncbi:MFS transporter [Fusobacterium simiae]|uniref:MFS transporter n=1 Tax=Fusobacterium simiae TaxID=855 RepID=A0ABT4DKX5_FUSSI|nr:MFS transporter [Fusobacterium simiae]MCY7009270.1 MFS transporter [Fusobacterium simiae]